MQSLHLWKKKFCKWSNSIASLKKTSPFLRKKILYIYIYIYIYILVLEVFDFIDS